MYFSFITLTTIGFGDFSPENSFVGIEEPGAGFLEFFKMVFTTVYCAIGKVHLTFGGTRNKKCSYFKVCFLKFKRYMYKKFKKYMYKKF